LVFDLQPTRSPAAAATQRNAMAYHVEHLHSVEAVDDTINREGNSESGRLVIVRFGRGGHDDCARLDTALAATAERVGPAAALFAVDTNEVRGFNDMYQLLE
jgi:DIM1 family U5 snRNP protein